MSAVEEAECGERPHRGETALVVPRADPGVEDRVGEREEELDVEVDTVLFAAVTVPPRNELREQVPMAGRQLRPRAVGPVLSDQLLFVGQRCTEREQLLRLGDVVCRAVERGPGRGAQLAVGGERERRHVLPLRADERGRDGRATRVAIAERLPRIRIVNRSRIEGDAEVHRLIRGDVAGVVGVGNARQAPRILRPALVNSPVSAQPCDLAAAADSAKRRQMLCP